MQNRNEFIEEHWDEALAIAENMRQIAEQCAFRFFGEPCSITFIEPVKEDWEGVDGTYWYFDFLAYKYALAALGMRILKHREAVEIILMLAILQATIGRICTYPLLAGDFEETGKIPLREPLPAGLFRMQKGLELVRYNRILFGTMPRSYEELNIRKFPYGSELKRLISMLFAKKKTTEQKEALQLKVADELFQDVKLLLKDWSVKSRRSDAVKEWMLADLD